LALEAVLFDLDGTLLDTAPDMIGTLNSLRLDNGLAALPFQQVRAEAAKVVWPTRRETLITTGLVLMLVVFTSLFFLVVDEVLRTIVSLALGFGRGG